MLKLVFLLVFTITLISCDDDLVITISNGKIRGVSITPPVTGNLTYYGFLGIPFAAPPVGKLRFQPPQPAAKWDGIYEANNNSVSCYPVDKDDIYQTEDCLYLNVYTPLKPRENKKLPVIVYIYGGGFIHGHAFYNNEPAFFLTYELIFVTFNYRVGPFGFLSTGDTVIPGNMGLKDQQFALKWVQENIEFFGGDPQKVTIMGGSAGSASVTYQLLSPGSKGLFRAAVGISGSALTVWAYQRNAVDTAYGIAAEIDPNFNRSRSTKDLSDLLMNVDVSEIVKTRDKYKEFSPVIEVPHDGAIISDVMYTTAEKGLFNKVPVFMGFNSEEGIGVAQNMENWKRQVLQYDNDPRILVSDEMNITDDNIKMEVGKLIRSIYMGDQPFGDNVGKAVQYYSDNIYMRSVVKFADLIMPYVDLYFYEFAYHGVIGQNNVSIPGIGRVAHAEDQYYTWALKDNYDIYPESDFKTLQRFVRLITNFVRFLTPTPTDDELFDNIKWPKASRNNFTYLEIDTELSLKQNPRNFSYGPWVQIFEKYVKKPFISF